jgi:predicted nuclease with TOPRIM domain
MSSFGPSPLHAANDRNRELAEENKRLRDKLAKCEEACHRLAVRNRRLDEERERFVTEAVSAMQMSTTVAETENKQLKLEVKKLEAMIAADEWRRLTGKGE